METAPYFGPSIEGLQHNLSVDVLFASAGDKLQGTGRTPHHLDGQSRRLLNVDIVRGLLALLPDDPRGLAQVIECSRDLLGLREVHFEEPYYPKNHTSSSRRFSTEEVEQSAETAFSGLIRSLFRWEAIAVPGGNVVKARWACEQMHEQMKEELGLDHFEGRSWRPLHHHAVLSMIAFTFASICSSSKKTVRRSLPGARLSRWLAAPTPCPHCGGPVRPFVPPWKVAEQH